MSRIVGIIDYGAGNLYSIYHAVKKIIYEITTDVHILLIKELEQIPSGLEVLIIPGDGAFPYAYKELKNRGFLDFIRAYKDQIYILGICVGFQLLFSSSEEYGGSEGINLIDGEVKSLKRLVDKTNIRVPHMGWNQVNSCFDSHCNNSKVKKIFNHLNRQEYFYFVHSYYLEMRNILNNPNVLMTVDYGKKFPVGVMKGKTFGFQFHPEKSYHAGMQVLCNFLSLALL